MNEINNISEIDYNLIDIHNKKTLTWYNQLAHHKNLNQLFKDKILTDFIDAGDSSFKLNKYDEALHFYKKAISINPTMYECRLNRSDCFIQLKLYQFAI
jgi:tetratricopeptide (TPR) repeat protein